MIQIFKSLTADSRSCDWSKVSIEQLTKSSEQHIRDVQKGLYFISGKLGDAARLHDYTKITKNVDFHKDFSCNFATKDWLDYHYAMERHHIMAPGGLRDDVNLVDVLEHIVDCVMAGKARTGIIFPIVIDPEILQKAVDNTVKMLGREIVVMADRG